MYSWSLALTQGGGTTEKALIEPLASGSAVRTDAERPAIPDAVGQVQPTWLDQMQWTDEQWRVLVEALAERAPERAAQVCALEAALPSTPGVSLRVARTAWPLLDTIARRTWLDVCAVSFSGTRLYSAS